MRSHALGVEVAGDAAGNDFVHQVAVAEQLAWFSRSTVFLEYPELGEAERQRHVVTEIAEIAEVVGDALQLQQQGAQRQMARGDGVVPVTLSTAWRRPRHRPRCCRR